MHSAWVACNHSCFPALYLYAPTRGDNPLASKRKAWKDSWIHNGRGSHTQLCLVVRFSSQLGEDESLSGRAINQLHCLVVESRSPSLARHSTLDTSPPLPSLTFPYLATSSDLHPFIQFHLLGKRWSAVHQRRDEKKVLYLPQLLKTIFCVGGEMLFDCLLPLLPQ